MSSFQAFRQDGDYKVSIDCAIKSTLAQMQIVHSDPMVIHTSSNFYTASLRIWYLSDLMLTKRGGAAQE